jgi:uncharacterized protein
MTDDPKEPISSAVSPCIRNCCLDENDICMGCDRSLSEILVWGAATENEKREILITCRLRHKQRMDQINERFNHVRYSRRNT